MFIFADPEDHAIMVNDMVQRSNNFKKEHHMKKIEQLARRHYGLKLRTVQERLIKVLESQAEDMQVAVDNINSPFNTVKDNEIKGYLVYLLHTQNHHKRQIEKEREKLKASNKQVTDAYRRLCVQRKEFTKTSKKSVKGISAAKTIEMYDSRLERIMHQMGTMATQNENYRMKIHAMFLFRRQFYWAYHALLKKNRECREMASHLLDNAVMAYRGREDFIYKSEVLKERFKIDMEKIRINNVLLHRIKERDIKVEEFESIKNQIRIDCRSTEIEDMVEKGITGLEEKLEEAEKEHSAIVKVSGASDVESISLQFQRQENENFNNFRYAETLNEEQDRFTSQIKILRQTIKQAEEGLSGQQRRSRKDLGEQQAKVLEISKEVAEAVEKRDEARKELRRALDHLKSLCEFVIGTQEGRTEEFENSDTLEESSVAEKMSQWLADVEDVIGQNLMLVEYLRYLRIETEEDKDRHINSASSLGELSDDLKSDRLMLEEENEKGRPRLLSTQSIKIGVMKDIAESDHFMDLNELQNAAHFVVDKPATTSVSEESHSPAIIEESSSSNLSDEEP